MPARVQRDERRAGVVLVLRARPAAARLVSRVSGAAMIGLGLLLGVEQLIL
ncbi:hypothetical protein [Cellulomonas sp. P5_C6]